MMATQEPMLFEELSLRRSNNYKDPNRPLTAYMTGSSWNKYPTKRLKQVITPKVLKMDKQGCDNIMSSFEGIAGGAGEGRPPHF